MKTFVTDDYQITLMDNGCVKVAIYNPIIYIGYNPNKRKPWTIYEGFFNYTQESKNITDLKLEPYRLKKLHKALEVVGKQDLMDNEIIFVNKEGE